MKRHVSVLVVVASVMITFSCHAEEPKKPEPAKKVEKLSKTEGLAINALVERQNAIQNDIREFSMETCKAHQIPLADCSIDPQTASVSWVAAPLLSPPVNKK